MAKRKHRVIFQPSARRGLVEEGISLLEASRRLGADVEAYCGGNKICGKCKVRIEEDFFEKFGIASSARHVSEWEEAESRVFSQEQRDQGFRLACAAKVLGDLLVYVPEESRAGKQVVSKAAREIDVEWDPAVKLYCVEMEEPTLHDCAADLERLQRALEETHGLQNLTVDGHALRRLSAAIREGKWSATAAVWMGREIIDVRPGRQEDSFGVAIDAGTTTVAAYLCNLRTMEIVATASMINPQCKYGEDVMARITYHQMNPGGLEAMSRDLVEGLNELIEEACRTAHLGGDEGNESGRAPKVGKGSSETETGKLHIGPVDILDMTVVGNTAIHHILLQLDPRFLGQSPFTPVIRRGLDIKARDLGIRINESAYIHVLPNQAGFVGGDNVAALIVEKPHKSDDMQLIIDIGTNGELVLGNRKRLLSCSCATGPALEGAQLSCGMRAAPGAIERIRIDPDTHEVDYKVVGREAWKSYSEPGNMRVKGICGSGILDVLAELYLSRVITRSGRFSREQKSDRFRVDQETGQPEFVIAWADETSMGRDVVITQKDVRQIQLAKGALYAGCKLMMRRMGLDAVDRIKIAGAFGTHVDKRKALIMGLFPDCDLDRVEAVGNAAGDGARAALLNRGKRDEAERISRSVEYVELTLEEDFQQEFIAAMHIPHMTDQFPHLEGIVPRDILRQT